MTSYYRYLSLFLDTVQVQQSKHRKQRMPLSPQGYDRHRGVQRNRRAARKHSQRVNRHA